jgi:tRNA threonylcarbamoyladenosine biosynthesis protein TsaE
MKISNKTLNNLQDTEEFARQIAANLVDYRLLLLKGDLGSGKTTFCSYLINHLLGKNENVTSPTFNILKTYENSSLNIFHYDLYRMKNFEEIYEIGLLENLDNGISIIEWPEIIENEIENYQKIYLKISSDKKNIRTVAFEFIN